MWEEIYRIQQENLEPASALGNVFVAFTDEAIALYQEGKIEESFAMADKALKIARKDGGDDHMGTALVTTIMARLYSAEGEHEEALKMQEHSLKVWAYQMNKLTLTYIMGLMDYGDLLMAADRQNEAKDAYEEALERAELAPGQNKEAIIGDALVHLADYYRQQNENSIATALYRRAISNYQDANEDFSAIISELEQKTVR